jgi:hypothetical protein
VLKKRAGSATPVFLCVSEKWRSFSRRHRRDRPYYLSRTIAPLGWCYSMFFLSQS